MTADPRTIAHVTALGRLFPILSWLPRYGRSWPAVDIIADLTLWGLAAPEAMAYAGIAGLPPPAGLSALPAALLIYAVFGTSRPRVVQAASPSERNEANTSLVRTRRLPASILPSARRPWRLAPKARWTSSIFSY